MSYISGFIEIIIFVVFGITGYFCFGEGKTPELLMLRPFLVSQHYFNEYILLIILFMFFIFNNIGLCLYIPGLRNVMRHLFNIKDTKVTFILLSIFPFIFGFSVSIAKPSITFLFWILGLIVCNYNGFIIPCLLKLRIMQPGLTIKKMGIYSLLLFYISSMVFGTYYKIYN